MMAHWVTAELQEDFSNCSRADTAAMRILRGEAERMRAAEFSARAESSALLGSAEAELLNLGLEGRAFHAEPRRGPCETSDDPVALMQGLEDMLPLGQLQSRVQGVRRGRRHARRQLQF